MEKLTVHELKVLEFLLAKLDCSRHTGWLGIDNHMVPMNALELVRKLIKQEYPNS